MSDISYQSINENFPVPGQDNNTQTFRDNFDTIKNSLRIANNEITELQDTTAKINQPTDFELNEIQNAVLENVRTQITDLGVLPPQGSESDEIEINFKNSSYQIVRLQNDATLNLLNLPGDNRIIPIEDSSKGVGKITLELYSNTESSYTVSFLLSSGTIIKKSSDFPDPLIVNSATDPIFIEVWRHSESTIFMRYLGQFS